MTDDSTIGKIEASEQPAFVDAGNVIILMNGIPVPLTAVFEQLFGVLGDIDRRLINLEEGPEEKSSIITV